MGGAAAKKVGELVSSKPDFDCHDELRSSKDEKTQAEGKPKEAPPLEDDPDSDLEGVETLSDIDDEDLQAYLLDPEEQQHKSDIWHEVNKDYLEDWHVRGQEAKRK